MRVVIVGASLAGANAAAGLRDAGFDGEVVLVGAEPDLPFGRPPLSKTYLRGDTDLSGWIPKTTDWYAEHGVELRTSTRVERIDPPNRRIVLRDGGEITCDRVVIATGCRPRVPRIPGADLHGVFTLRTRADADAIRSLAQPGATAVVAGMSFIGSEVAASLRVLGVEVTAVFPGEHPLASVLGPQAGAAVGDIHRRHGVQLLAGDKIAGFKGTGRVERAVTESGREIECSMVVVGLGVEPNLDMLDGSGVATGDGVVVDAACRTNIDGIVAAGDVASHDHPLFGRIRVEHYNNAEKQGRHAARTLLGSADPYDYVHTFWSDQYDDKLEYVGFAKQWDTFVVRGDLEAGVFLGFYLDGPRLAAAMGLNRGGDPELEPDSELAACSKLIGERTPVSAAQLADEAVDLWHLG